MAKWTALLVAVAWLALPRPVEAQLISDYSAALITPGGRCLLPDKVKGELRAYSCTVQGARWSLKNGVVRNAAGQCWDHGIPESNTSFIGRTAVHLVKCNGNLSQQWYFFSAHPTKSGIVQSAANKHACITMPEKEFDGAPAVVAKCDNYTRPSSRQAIYLGERLTDEGRRSAQQHVERSVWRRLSARGFAALEDGTHMVAAGGGNIIVAPGPAMVAAGGGNMVAAGGGNMVAAGGGNMIQPGGGNVLPSGAGNVLPSGAGGILPSAAGIIAAAGGGRLVGNNGNSLAALAGVGLK